MQIATDWDELDVSNSRFSALMGWAERLMTDGPQLTPFRRDVFDLLKASPRPIKAYELWALLSERRGRVTPPTVYRTLNFLVECGLIHRIESLNATRRASMPPAGSEHVFFICGACGDVSEVESLDARIALDAALKEAELPSQPGFYRGEGRMPRLRRGQQEPPMTDLVPIPGRRYEIT